MLTRKFHPNPRFDYMCIYDGVLFIAFKNGKARSYECDNRLAYKLYYQSSAKLELEFYANQIKNKLKVLNVK